MLTKRARTVTTISLLVAVVLLSAISSVISNSSPGLLKKTPQAASDSFPSKIKVRLFDSVTGYGIQPTTLDAVTMKSDLQEFRIQSKENNTTFLQAPQGTYELAVRVEGYKPATTVVSLEQDLTSLEILLDPIPTPPEMTAEAIKLITRPDATSIIGYVIDEQTGRPLRGVGVSLTDGSLRARTNRRGFFVLQIPLDDSNPEGPPALRDILFQLTGYTSEERHRVQVFPGIVTTYHIRLKPGTGPTNIIDESQHRNNAAGQFDGPQPQSYNAPPPESEHGLSDSPNGSAAGPPQDTITLQSSAVTVPTQIRVGINCSDAHHCTGVMTMSLDEYCKHVLPAEWSALWDMNSLKAGAVAVRSFGAWYVGHPLTARYDICSTTSCDVFGSTTSSTTNAAVDQTAGVVLVDGSNNIVRSEFSRENNDKAPCRRDCQTGTCISDNVCCGDFSPGTGSGMCQQGSQRWASGTKFGSPGHPVSSGNPPQDWTWILSHYYPSNRIAGLPASDFSITTTPIVQTVTRGSNATCRVDVQGLNGFGGQVALSAINLPTGYAGAFWSPSSVVIVPTNGNASSTLVVFTNSNTYFGTTTTTIKAVSGSIVKEKFIQITITGTDPKDQQAQQDMRNRAARDSRFSAALPETFGKDLNWTSDFELRWMAFGFVGNRFVYIYHARAKASGNRFTNFVDPISNQWVGWQQAF
jgi:stage II sporulation SpoD-like protein